MFEDFALAFALITPMTPTAPAPKPDPPPAAPVVAPKPAEPPPVQRWRLADNSGQLWEWHDKDGLVLWVKARNSALQAQQPATTTVYRGGQYVQQYQGAGPPTTTITDPTFGMGYGYSYGYAQGMPAMFGAAGGCANGQCAR